MIEQVSYEVSRLLAVKKDEVLSKVIPGSWDKSEIMKRCRLVKRLTDPETETLYIDDEPIVTFGKPEITISSKEGEMSLNVNQPLEYHHVRYER